VEKITNFDDFAETFNKSEDEYREHFTFAGLKVLYDYLTLIEHDCPDVTHYVDGKLDVVGLCGNYVECSLEQLNHDCGDEFTQWETMDEAEEWLLQNTVYVGRTNYTLLFCPDGTWNRVKLNRLIQKKKELELEIEFYASQTIKCPK